MYYLIAISELSRIHKEYLNSLRKQKATTLMEIRTGESEAELHLEAEDEVSEIELIRILGRSLIKAELHPML